MALVPWVNDNVTVVLEGDSFLAGDRETLLEKGVRTITDASGTYVYDWQNPTGGLVVDDNLIGNLDGDHIYAPPTGMPVQLDADIDTVIRAGQLPISLNVNISSFGDTMGSVSLVGGITGIRLVDETPPDMKIPGMTSLKIYIGEKRIGTLTQDDDQSGSLSITFEMVPNPNPMMPPMFSTPAITADELKTVIRALHYTTEAALGSEEEINISLNFGGFMTPMPGIFGESHTITAHAIPSPTNVLTAGSDVAIGNLGNDDVFAVMRNSLTEGDFIDGGVGYDTLWMVESGTLDLRLPSILNSIEAVRGTDGVDTIYVSAERPDGLNVIDGGRLSGYDYDRLVITGDVVDLRNVEILGFDAIEFRASTAALHFTNVAQALLFMDDTGTRYVSSNNLEVVLDIDDVSEEDRIALFSTRFSKITDGMGREYTQYDPGFPIGDPPVLKFLDGDHVTAGWNAAVRLDSGLDAIVENPEGNLSMLTVSFSEHLRRSQGHNAEIDVTGAVKLAGGWADGSQILVNNKEVGTLGFFGADIPDFSDLGFFVMFNESASAADAQAIIRAITYRYNGSSTSAQEIDAWIWLGENGTFGANAQVKISVAGATPPPPPPPPTSFETTTNFTLPADALNVTASGRGDVKLTGNDLGNVIVGNDGKNTINAGGGNDKVSGGRGNDMLAGGLGNDELAGGSGKDSFVFNAKFGTSKTNRKVNFDTVTDFKAKDDSIYLDDAVFKKLGKGSPTKPVKLNKDFFSLDKAKDKNDYILYNKKTGVLSYDADGSGKGKAIEFALLKNKTTVKYDDFFVV
ncbi:calcium-binding protein [Microvirga sp. 0TCS3.31]